MPKKQVIGVVTSDKMDKSRRVEIPRLVKHPKYGKYIRRRTICYVHDEDNVSKMGDSIEIVECPPKSKKKRWEFVRVVAESKLVDLAAMRAAAKIADGQDEGGSEVGSVGVAEPVAATAEPASDGAPDGEGEV